MIHLRHSSATMASLVYRRAAVRFLSFPRVDTGYVRQNFLMWVKTAEAPIWCARFDVSQFYFVNNKQDFALKRHCTHNHMLID